MKLKTQTFAQIKQTADLQPEKVRSHKLNMVRTAWCNLQDWLLCSKHIGTSKFPQILVVSVMKFSKVRNKDLKRFRISRLSKWIVVYWATMKVCKKTMWGNKKSSDTLINQESHTMIGNNTMRTHKKKSQLLEQHNLQLKLKHNLSLSHKKP